MSGMSRAFHSLLLARNAITSSSLSTLARCVPLTSISTSLAKALGTCRTRTKSLCLRKRWIDHTIWMTPAIAHANCSESALAMVMIMFHTPTTSRAIASRRSVMGLGAAQAAMPVPIKKRPIPIRIIFRSDASSRAMPVITPIIPHRMLHIPEPPRVLRRRAASQASRKTCGERVKGVLHDAQYSWSRGLLLPQLGQMLFIGWSPHTRPT